MPLKIIRSNNRQIIGKGAVLLSSPPAADQSGDLYTGQLVEEAALLSRAHALIEKETAKTTDSLILESALKDFQSSIDSIVEEFQIKCVLDIRGQVDPGIEIRLVQAGPVELAGIIKDRFEGEFDLRVVQSESAQPASHADKVQVVRLLLGPEERALKKELVISRIAVAVGLMNAKLGYSETDERAGGVLD